MTRFEVKLAYALADNDCDEVDAALAEQCARCMRHNTTPCVGKCWYEDQANEAMKTIIWRTPAYTEE